MKESRLYLNFLKGNLLVILLPTLFFGTISFFYVNSLPPTYSQMRLYQINSSTLQDAINLADQAVTLIRTSNIQKDLDLKEISIQSFKSGPALIVVEVSGNERASIGNGSNKIADFLKQKYQLEEQGVGVILEKPKPYLKFILAGSFLGFFGGLVISLIRAYFKNF